MYTHIYIYIHSYVYVYKHMYVCTYPYWRRALRTNSQTPNPKSQTKNHKPQPLLPNPNLRATYL